MTYVPKLGGAGAAAFPRQFEDVGIDPLSMAVTAIEHLSNDGVGSVLSHGTGFFWRQDDEVFLVTARHVLSGLDPFTDKLMSKDGFIPERVRIFPAFVGQDQWSRSDGFIVDLNGKDGRRLWLQDPEFDTLRTDIAALRISISPPDGHTIMCVNDTLSAEKVLTQVGFDVSVVGHPTNQLSGLRTPVWRRGTIASEPYLPVDGKPMFLVDASTSPGFSGSPVLRRHVGAVPIKQEDGSISVVADRILTTTLIGVYAGRLQHSHFGGEVPFAFYANRIPFIVSKPQISLGTDPGWLTGLVVRNPPEGAI